MLSQLVSVPSLTLIGVLTVDVLRLRVVRPSMVSVRVRSPAVGFGRQDWTVRSQSVMSYGAGTVTRFWNERPSLSVVFRVPLCVARMATPLAIARAEAPLVEVTWSFAESAFSNAISAMSL